MKIKYLLIIAAAGLIVGGWQVLAHRSYTAALKNTIVTKDNSALDTTGDQQVLKNYVANHMGTSTEVFMEGSYNRAAEAAKGVPGQPSGEVYARAQQACSSRTDSVTQAKCVQNYVSTNAAPASNPQPAVMPTREAHTLKFKAPGWTADSAGLAFLIAVSSLVLAGYLRLVRK